MVFPETLRKSGARTARAGSLLWLSVLAVAVVISGCDDGGSSVGTMDSAGQGAGVLKGTINIEPGSRVDRDTALGIVEGDPDADRNNPQNADSDAPFPGDVTLGGYVSATAGDYNPSFSYPEDEKDSFLLDLEGGDRIGVDTFAVQGSGNVNIKLIDSNDAEVDPNEGDESSFAVDQPGVYRLLIEAMSGGPVRYLVRQRSSSGSSAGADFVPGEALVTLKSKGSGDRIRVQAAMPMLDLPGRQLGGNRMQVSMHETDLLSTQSTEISRRTTQEWIDELRRTPGVASAAPNYSVERAGIGADSASASDGRDWHQQLINAHEAWDKDITGDGVTIAVLDSWVFEGAAGIKHPGLEGNIKCSVCPDLVSRESSDSNLERYHGTHVAGIAATTREPTEGADLEGDHQRGIAYDVTLLPVRVLRDDGVGTQADVIAGIEWVINAGGEPRADIINLSLGSPSTSPAFESALQEADAAGIHVVAAAGNQGTQEEVFPAAHPTALSVGSITCNGERSFFSSFGDWLSLAAPGGGGSNECRGGVYSTYGSEDNKPVYSDLAGTSMASPQVAAALALMGQEYGIENFEPAVIRAMIREGGLTDREGGGFNIESGRGVLDLKRALVQDPTIFSALKPDREWLRLSRAESTGTIEFSEVGQPADFSRVDVSLTEEVDWLAEPVRESERAFSFALNEFESGRSYQTMIDVSYASAGEPRSYQIPVSASIDELAQLEAGVHFVQLIHEDEFTGDSGIPSPVIQRKVGVGSGQYQFELDVSELEPGMYYLLAGSDIDNDGVLGQPGEAYGIFTGDGSIARAIEISPSMEKSVSFETGFRRPESPGVARQTRRELQRE